jgi:hypothetical protein
MPQQDPAPIQERSSAHRVNSTQLTDWRSFDTDREQQSRIGEWTVPACIAVAQRTDLLCRRRANTAPTYEH